MTAPMPAKMTPTEMRQALEKLRAAADGDEQHRWELRVALSSALEEAKRSEKQALCPHSRRPVVRMASGADFHDCPDCGKTMQFNRPGQ